MLIYFAYVLIRLGYNVSSLYILYKIGAFQTD